MLLAIEKIPCRRAVLQGKQKMQQQKAAAWLGAKKTASVKQASIRTDA